MVALLHISDLHFGSAHDPAAAQAILALVAELAPSAVVCTGDVVEHAESRRAWQAAQNFFAAIDRPVVLVPGNHDIPRLNVLARLMSPRQRFREHLRPHDTPVLHLDGAVIAGIDTPRRWTLDLGFVGDACLQRVESAFAAAPPDALRVVALHHPLRPLGLPFPRSHVRGSDRASATLARLKADVVLTGHNHFPHLETITHPHGSFHWAQAGTGSSKRFRLGRVRVASVNVLRRASTGALHLEWWYHLREEGRFVRGERHALAAPKLSNL